MRSMSSTSCRTFLQGSARSSAAWLAAEGAGRPHSQPAVNVAANSVVVSIRLHDVVVSSPRPGHILAELVVGKSWIIKLSSKT